MSESSQQKSTNVVWHASTVQRGQREQRNGHKGAVLWFTGLSGAGKSTLANAVESVLHDRGCRTFVLDGDNIRHGLCSDLGFSDTDRVENIRRIGEVAHLFVESGVIVLTAFISPFRSDRSQARSLCAAGDFFEVYCDSDLATCEQRDVKGLYGKARAGEIPAFTGISSPYEAPADPEIVADTGHLSLAECAEQVVTALVRAGVIQADA